jgi:hypothetical protein
MAMPSPVDSGGFVAGAAGGDQHVAGPDLDPVPRRAQRHDPAATPAVDQQVEGEPVLVGGRRGPLHRGHQRPLDLDAGGGAAGVDDPGVGVAALPGQQ